MISGRLRTRLARLAAATGCLCGVLGLIAGAQDVVWKFGSTGWFTGGSLLTLLALFELIDGVVARQRSEILSNHEPEPPQEVLPPEKSVWRPSDRAAY
jgi:hypothetical protein